MNESNNDLLHTNPDPRKLETELWLFAALRKAFECSAELFFLHNAGFIAVT